MGAVCFTLYDPPSQDSYIRFLIFSPANNCEFIKQVVHSKLLSFPITYFIQLFLNPLFLINCYSKNALFTISKDRSTKRKLQCNFKVISITIENVTNISSSTLKLNFVIYSTSCTSLKKIIIPKKDDM